MIYGKGMDMADTAARTLKDVVTDFLGSAPTLEEIAVYRLPVDLQARAHDLLDRNRAGILTPEERAEMDEFSQIDHLMTMVKADLLSGICTNRQCSRLDVGGTLCIAVLYAIIAPPFTISRVRLKFMVTLAPFLRSASVKAVTNWSTACARDRHDFLVRQ